MTSLFMKILIVLTLLAMAASSYSQAPGASPTASPPTVIITTPTPSPTATPPTLSPPAPTPSDDTTPASTPSPTPSSSTPTSTPSIEPAAEPTDNNSSNGLKYSVAIVATALFGTFMAATLY